MNAINDNLKSIEKKKVWPLVDRLKVEKDGKKPNIIDSKWVFEQKNERFGTTEFKS